LLLLPLLLLLLLLLPLLCFNARTCHEFSTWRRPAHAGARRSLRHVREAAGAPAHLLHRRVELQCTFVGQPAVPGPRSLHDLGIKEDQEHMTRCLEQRISSSAPGAARRHSISDLRPPAAAAARSLRAPLSDAPVSAARPRRAGPSPAAAS
jgi:hypothetical protein